MHVTQSGFVDFALHTSQMLETFETDSLRPFQTDWPLGYHLRGTVDGEPSEHFSCVLEVTPPQGDTYLYNIGVEVAKDGAFLASVPLVGINPVNGLYFGKLTLQGETISAQLLVRPLATR